jgi:FKBP-type peptidyl-prolyl cis-trans isomerase
LRRMTPRIFLSFSLLAALAGCHAKQETPPVTEKMQAQKAPPGAPPGIAAPPDVKAPPADAQKLESGVWRKVLTPGTGADHPTVADEVSVHYTIWTTDGRMYDSTSTRGQAASFPLDRIPSGWVASLLSMVAGEKARFWIPEELAFKGRKDRPQGMNVIEFELISFKKGTPAPPLPPAPPDVAAAPADAEKTASGLALKVLTPGKGTVHPKLSDVVQATYTGWTTDGKPFDSSSGRPRTFELKALILGWQEGIPHMVEGEKDRLWIPASLAYQGKAEAPAGMLVYDVELVKIGK